ncbi:hypothetical protein F0562_024045 [Nyssa sinensis]|uniref:Uncharacterized protein n=1 Tax=Nyssa sinensis TaxID=561372 RepID=A0A5J5BIA7_9ASTE|nr:hypothetical protein F0562_024045 [Nyssa sinensis]
MASTDVSHSIHAKEPSPSDPMASLEASIHDKKTSSAPKATSSDPILHAPSLLSYPISGFCPGANVDRIDSVPYATENSRLSQRFSVLQQNTQLPPLHTNGSTSADTSQVNSTCHVAAASLLMQGDTLATNSAFRPAIRSLASAAGIHSVEVSIGARDPITLPASAECTRETHLISNGLELPSTLGIRDIPNASPDVVSLVANQIGGPPQGSTSAAAIQPASLTQDTERPTNYDIQVLKTMEVGASSNATLLDNSDSISAYASQPEFSTKIKDQQESSYTISPSIQWR